MTLEETFERYISDNDFKKRVKELTKSCSSLKEFIEDLGLECNEDELKNFIDDKVSQANCGGGDEECTHGDYTFMNHVGKESAVPGEYYYYSNDYSHEWLYARHIETYDGTRLVVFVPLDDKIHRVQVQTRNGEPVDSFEARLDGGEWTIYKTMIHV